MSLRIPSRLTLLAALLVAPLSVAAAHPRLVRATPAANSRVESAPSALTITFNETLSIALCRLTLHATDGTAIKLDTLAAAEGDAKTLTARIPSALGPGRYTVKWQAAGGDGHPVRGEFSFEVVAGQPPPRR